MTAAIIQARMGSTRFPGKIMKEIKNTPLLQYQIDRVKRSAQLDKIIVATSILPENDVVERFCGINVIECFRGSEDDVLDRYYQCAKKYNVDIIVRLTADCPLSDPKMIDDMISFFKSKKFDYAANTVPHETSKYPNGSDVEIFTMKALERAQRECEEPECREHVTHYFWKQDKGFKNLQFDNEKDNSKYRLTVDFEEDLKVIKEVIENLYFKDPTFSFDDAIEFLDKHPEIRKINRDVAGKQIDRLVS